MRKLKTQGEMRECLACLWQAILGGEVSSIKLVTYNKNPCLFVKKPSEKTTLILTQMMSFYIFLKSVTG